MPSTSRLNVVFERYPELKASDLYREAQEGMKQYEENVRMSRMIYNDTATKMNRMVRQWPSSIVASMLHFDQKDDSTWTADLSLHALDCRSGYCKESLPRLHITGRLRYWIPAEDR